MCRSVKGVGRFGVVEVARKVVDRTLRYFARHLSRLGDEFLSVVGTPSL